MAKPTKYATPISLVLTIVAIVGIIAGLILAKPLVIALLLLPTVIYEVYRTEGESTKWASWVLLGVIIAEILLIIFNINFDLASFLGESEKYVAGYSVPLGDVKVVGPAIMAVLSVILFTRTNGKYTKWLSVVIFITSFALIFTLSPETFKTLLKFALEEGLNSIN